MENSFKWKDFSSNPNIFNKCSDELAEGWDRISKILLVVRNKLLIWLRVSWYGTECKDRLLDGFYVFNIL